MSAWVYFLQSQTNKRYYIGSSTDPEKRLKNEHNKGKVKATKNRGPWSLVFKHQCKNMTTARKLEWKLKQLKSKKIIEKIIEDGYLKMKIDGD